jgi:hypothetical protein
VLGSARALSQAFLAFLFISALPFIESLPGDAVVPAGGGHAPTDLLGAAKNSEAMEDLTFGCL